MKAQMSLCGGSWHCCLDGRLWHCQLQVSNCKPVMLVSNLCKVACLAMSATLRNLDVDTLSTILSPSYSVFAVFDNPNPLLHFLINTLASTNPSADFTNVLSVD
jgi:hypothetical protein